MNPSVSKLTAPLNKGAANGGGLILLRNNSVATRHSSSKLDSALAAPESENGELRMVN